MQAETLNPQVIEWLFKGGNISFLAACVFLFAKVLKRLNRDESLHRDYPPHRHINGSRIVYPNEFQPTPIERLDGQGS